MGAVTNIILDPILIYGWLGMPAMGVKGAAYATVIGQIVSFVAALIFHLSINTVIRNKLCYFKPSLNTIKDIYAIGFAAIISQALISVMTKASLQKIYANAGVTTGALYIDKIKNLANHLWRPMVFLQSNAADGIYTMTVIISIPK